MDIRAALEATLGDAYRLERELAGAGMSRVFVAEERSLGRKVVIKVLPPELAEAVSVERFKREIGLAARLQHPHIVPLLTAGEAAGLPFYTMPFVSGESLRVRLKRDGPLALGDTVRILRDVATALAYAHGEGVVHRDIKPDNVLLSAGSAAVADFGVAKALDASAQSGGTSLTTIGARIGTPGYIAPEQAAGDAGSNHRVDIYSWGAMAYEMLAGAPPFEGAPQDVIAKHLAEAPVSVARKRSDVPPALASLVMQCLEKRPDRRPQQASELAARLEAMSIRSTSASRWVARWAGTGQGDGARRTWQLGLGVLALAIVALSLRQINGRRGSVGRAAVWSSRMTPVIEPENVIALLPFTSLSLDTGTAYFAAGMTEEVASRLSIISALRFFSGGAIRTYATAPDGRLRMARDLGVAKVIDGSVRVTDESAHVEVRLTNARSGQLLWAQKEDGLRAGMLRIQDRLARATMDALQMSLTPDEARRAGRPATVNPAAYDLYLRARALGGANPASINLLKAAIALDSTYAIAYSMLAYPYLTRSEHGTPADIDSAHAAARHALALDPESTRGHAAMAVVYAYMDRMADSRESSLRGLELAPNSAALMTNLSVTLGFLGRFDEQVHWAERGLAFTPDVGAARYFLALGLVNAGDYSAADLFVNRALARFPTDSRLVIERSVLDLFEGHHSSAIARIRAAATSGPDDLEVQWCFAALTLWASAPDAEVTVARFASANPTGRTWHMMESLRTMHAFLLAKRGARSRADSLFDVSLADDRADIAAGVDNPNRPMEIAAINAVRGDTAAALTWLERGYRAGFRLPEPLMRNPFFASLRSNPEFLRIVDRIRVDAAVMLKRVKAEHDSLFRK